VNLDADCGEDGVEVGATRAAEADVVLHVTGVERATFDIHREIPNEVATQPKQRTEHLQCRLQL